MGGLLAEVKCPQPMIPRPLDFPFGFHRLAGGFETILFASSDHSTIMGPLLEWKWWESCSFSYRISFPCRIHTENRSLFPLFYFNGTDKIAKVLEAVGRMVAIASRIWERSVDVVYGWEQRNTSNCKTRALFILLPFPHLEWFSGARGPNRREVVFPI